MCLINGPAPTKHGSSVMLPVCQHSTLASVGRCRQSEGNPARNRMVGETQTIVAPCGLPFFCLRETSMSTVGVLVARFSLVPCGFFLLCITQKTIASLTLPSIKLFLHPALKAKSPHFLQDVFVY